MKVKCPACKKVSHETTESFNPDVRPNGSMVELLDPWKSWGWGKFGNNRPGGKSVVCADMECLHCEAPLAPSGRLLVIGTITEMNQQRIRCASPLAEDEEVEEVVMTASFSCPHCDWTGKTSSAVKRHITMKH